MGRAPLTDQGGARWGASGSRRLPGPPSRSVRRCSMRHDDTTYMDDDGMGFVVLGDDGESEEVLPVTVTAGGRQWAYGEEAWGGWDPE